MYINKILCDNNLSSNEKLVLMYLVSNSIDNKIAILNDILSEKLSLNIRTIYFIIRKLKEHEYIRLEFKNTSRRIIHILKDFE